VLALELNRRGWSVTLFDRDGEEGRNSCSWTGAGMLAPSCELDTAGAEVASLGLISLGLWPELLARLAGPVYHQHRGSVVVAHPSDRGELERMKGRIIHNAPAGAPGIQAREITASTIAELEPDLGDRFSSGIYMPNEAHVDNRQLLGALAATLRRAGVAWHAGVPVDAVAPGRIGAGGVEHRFDWAVDCRGLGARGDVPRLRGVRGELLYLHAPDVSLSRPVRLLHPRYTIYIVPRPDHRYVVGATQIESDDDKPITVRSALELLSAAYTVQPAFAEATLVETSVSCRPAFPDNKPRILGGDGRLRVNGLYRHGFLMAPVMTRLAADYMEGHPVSAELAMVLEEEERGSRLRRADGGQAGVEGQASSI
jgi:glycine oxidase